LSSLLHLQARDQLDYAWDRAAGALAATTLQLLAAGAGQQLLLAGEEDPAELLAGLDALQTIALGLKNRCPRT